MFATALLAQKLEFDVASVKPDKSDEEPYSNFSLDSGFMFSNVGNGDALKPQSGYFAARNLSLIEYITFAYKLTGTQHLALRFEQFAGPTGTMPEWVTHDRFDIQARSESRRLVHRGEERIDPLCLEMSPQQHFDLIPGQKASLLCLPHGFIR